MSLRVFLLVGLLWTLATLLPGQTQELGAPFITNYETEQFGASHQNWVSVQDRRGVMYFGNTSGILEFDGQRWQLIPVLGNAPTRALTCGPDGTIYYGSIGDFGFLTSSPTGKIYTVSLQAAIPKAERAFNDVWQVESTTDGIYFLTRSRIFRFHNGKITILPGKFATSQTCVLNGTLFYADMEKGICQVNGDQVAPIPQLAGVYNGKHITMAPFDHHKILIGRLTGDFLCIDLSALWNETSQRYVSTHPTPKDMVHVFSTELKAFLKDSNAFPYKLVHLRPDAFAITTLKAGIITFNREGKIVRAINKDGKLIDNSVSSILVDRASNLWATSNSGISHIELSVPQSVFGAHNGIDGVSITACFHNGRLYVGTYQNLFVQTPYHYTLKDDLPKFVPLKNSPNEIWQLLEVEGDLMAASGSGLFLIQDEKAFRVPGSADATCLSLSVSKQWPGHLFVGLMRGLEVFKRTSGQWKLVGRMDGVNENIRYITEDINGNLWLSTEVKGLLRANFSGGKPTEVVVHGFGPEHGLPGLTGLRAVFHGTTLSVLSPKGLFQADIQPWDAKGLNRTRFAPDLALGKAFSDPPPALNGMVPDGKGGLIFSTSEGVIWSIPGKGGQFQMITRPFQGLPSPEESMYLHPDGSLWLSGKYLVRVDPKAPKDYDQPFAVLVRKVIAKSNRIIFEGTHGHHRAIFNKLRTVFESSQDLLDVPELPFRENALSFEFAATFYEKPGTIQYQYLLEGFDKEWSKWSGYTRKEYTYLSEGKYRFRVRAKNVYGTIGREAVYSLRILPPWYRTWWAYIMWVIVGSAVLVGIIYLNTLKLRREKAHLENIVAERTRELKEAAQKLREASLTDPLTGLRNRRFIAEVLQNDIAAFIGLKNFQLNAKNQRRITPEDTVLGLFLMDIDFFKKVNDTYGHDAGDRVLKQFAAILTASVRQDDAVMRVGGEEFLVMLKKTMPEYLPLFAAKILQKVAATPFDIGGGTTIRKTCSIGYTGFPVYKEQPGLLTFEQSIMITDLGLFHAKNNGRNQCVYLKAGSRIPSGEEIIQKTITSLEFALQEDYLQIGYVMTIKELY